MSKGTIMNNSMIWKTLGLNQMQFEVRYVQAVVGILGMTISRYVQLFSRQLPLSMNSRKSDDRPYDLHGKSPFGVETGPDITIKRVLPTFTPSGDHTLRDGR